MQLGVFTKDPKTGILTGSVRTIRDFVEHVEIAPVANKRSDGSPDFRVFGPTGSDFGAGWNKIARDTNKPYISIVLHDPTFNDGQSLNPILAEGENNQFVMAWDAPDPSKAPTRPNGTQADAGAQRGPSVS